MSSRRPRPSLRQGLDQEVYQVVKKLLDEQPGSSPNIRPHEVYGWVQQSNSFLKRKPKKLLEDSIERVLSTILDDLGEGDEIEPIEGDFGSAEDSSANAMNKSIRSGWSTPGGANPVVANGVPSKKRESNGEPVTKRRKGERMLERPKPSDKISTAPPTGISLADIGGVDPIIDQLKEHLVLPLLWPELYAARKIPIPRGILLHGPPGCGKTILCKAFAATLDVPFIEILGPQIVSGMSGESEKNIRDRFEEAKKQAPCLIFIDEIDVIAPKRDTAQSQMEKRIVGQLNVSMDSVSMENNDGKPVIVLAATNKPDSIDPALRRGGRFGTEILMGVPNERMREQILRAQTRQVGVAADVNFAQLAKLTSGFVGADLADLVSKAATWTMDQFMKALEQQAAEEGQEMLVDEAAAGMTQSMLAVERLVKRAREKETRPLPAGYESTDISMEAFLTVLPTIQPSSKREGFATIPDTTWIDIGALQEVRKQLQLFIVERIKNPERFRKVGITAPSGILLCGPPGCGKTLLAKAVANESKANFISVKGPELFNKYVGESERAVRQLFMRARSSIPCVVFFDELDALVPKRTDSHTEASTRVVNTLLTELDGVSDREGIYVVGATNRPDMIDEAVLRPGRMGKVLFVGLPGPEERVEILTTLLRKSRIDSSLAEMARDERCKNFTGADLNMLLETAGVRCIERHGNVVEKGDFEYALDTVKASVEDERKWARLEDRFKRRLA